MIENEKFYFLKNYNDCYFYNLDIADFYYFLSDGDFDYDKIEKYRIHSMDNISENSMTNNFIVNKDFLEQLETKSKYEDLNIAKIISEYNNKEMIDYYDNDLLKINSFPVSEEFVTNIYSNPLEKIEIEVSIFKDLKKEIEACPFINCFDNGNYTIKRDLDTNEEFISLKISEDKNFIKNYIMDKNSLENIIEKYNVREFDYGQIPPDETQKELADISETNREEFQSHFDLAF